MEENLRTKEKLVAKQKELIAKNDAVLEKIERKLDEQKAVDTTSALRDFNKAMAKIKAALDNPAKKVLEQREELEEKLEKTKKTKIFITVAYLVAVIAIFAVLQLGFGTGALIAYAIAAIATVFVYIFPTKAITDTANNALKKTYEESCILEYDKKASGLRADFAKRTSDTKAYIDKLKAEEMELVGEHYDLQAEIEKLDEEIAEFDFNEAYSDTILFWGANRGNHYEIYIDGLHYSTVKGRQIFRIMLTPGLHSFKVRNTAYNIVDNSVDYSYVFPAEQFMAGDGPCHAIVCDFNKMREVNGAQFQKITKTKLM